MPVMVDRKHPWAALQASFAFQRLGIPLKPWRLRLW
jgi:hypothetical protein